MTDEEIIVNASEDRTDAICETDAEQDETYDDVEVLQATVDRKLGEIAELKVKLSRARSDANKNKHAALIDFLISDIVGYRTVISDLTDAECDLTDLEYDPDLSLDYDEDEIYDEYLAGLSEQDRDSDILADTIRNDYCDGVLEDVFYAVGMKILCNEELLDAVADSEFVVTELGRAAVMDDSLYDLIFSDAEGNGEYFDIDSAEGDDEEDDCVPCRRDSKKSKKGSKKCDKKSKKKDKKGKKKK